MPGFLHRFQIEDPHLARAVIVDQHGDAAAGARYRHDARALRQRDGVFDWRIAGAGVHPVADDGHHGGDGKHRGQARYHHHGAGTRDQLRRLGFGGIADR